MRKNSLRNINKINTTRNANRDIEIFKTTSKVIIKSNQKTIQNQKDADEAQTSQPGERQQPSAGLPAGLPV